MLPFTAQQYIKYLRSWEGYHETDVNVTPFGKYYGFQGGPYSAWCALFLAYGARMLGFDIRPLSPHFYSTVHLYQETCNTWSVIKRNQILFGDWLFIDWQGSTNPLAIDHICIALGPPQDGMVPALHGNLRDEVRVEAVPITYVCRAVRPPYAGAKTSPVVLPYPGGFYRRGSQGNTVKLIQDALKKRGYDCGATDGIYGPRTESTVRTYQSAMGLDVDGIVGPDTWQSLFRR